MSWMLQSKDSTVYLRLSQRKYLTGAPISLRSLGKKFIECPPASGKGGWEVLECLHSLNASFWEIYDSAVCLDKLHKIYELIVEDRNARDLDESMKNSPNVENLVSFGGVQVLQNLVLELPFNFESTGKTEVQKKKELETYDKVRFLAIQLLHTLSTSSPLRNDILSKLSSNLDLIRKLLDYLANRLLGYVSMLLLEDLMVHREEPLELRALDIDRLLTSLSLDQMSNLCRVLSYTVVDMGSEPEELLCAIDRTKRKATRNSEACEKNILYLASLPRLLVSVVEIVVRKFEPSNKLFMEYLGVAIDILEENSSPATSLIASIRMTYMANHDSTGQFPPLNNNTEQLISAMNRIEVNKDLTMRIEGCILLTGLLYGSGRSSTVDKLTQYRLIPRINDLFNFFFAIDPDTGTLTTEQYGFIEGESLIQSLRIQILRVIHSMCDQTVNNCALLTEKEFQKLEHTRDPHGVLAPVELTKKPHHMCRGSNGGLLTKLNNLAKVDLSPVYRFWLHRAIESFLRGKALYPYQVFMSEAGLIENTVDRILSLSGAGLPHRNGSPAGVGGFESMISSTMSSVTTASATEPTAAGATTASTTTNTSTADSTSSSAESSANTHSQVGHSYEDIIQCSFDLLAQMVKFNVSSLQLLSKRLVMATSAPGTTESQRAYPEPMDTSGHSQPVSSSRSSSSSSTWSAVGRDFWGRVRAAEQNQSSQSSSQTNQRNSRSNQAPSARWGGGSDNDSMWPWNMASAIMDTSGETSSGSSTNVSTRSSYVSDGQTGSRSSTMSRVTAGTSVVEVESRLQNFVNIIFDNIIDSNMFVRCIILTIDKLECMPGGSESSAMRDTSDNVLVRRFSHFQTRVKYICRILRCINVDTLTQDNVSCLNTALVILLFAKDRGQLPLYLEALQEVEMSSPRDCQLTFYFENMMQLCKFWKRHYQPNGQDVKCLVEGSGIEFSRWLGCVDTLSSTDPNCNTSLSFYSPKLLIRQESLNSL